MRPLLVLTLALLAAAASGCIRAPAEPLAQNDVTAAPAADAPLAEPQVLSWDGHITASPFGALAHSRDTEAAAFPVQTEGFVLDVTEVPQSMEVGLDWPGPGTAMVMVSTPHVDGKGVEYFTGMAEAGAQCLAIPAEGLMTGAWSVMIHTDGAVNADYTFTVTTVGGAAAILAGEPHSSAEAAETTEGEALPCAEAAAPEA